MRTYNQLDRTKVDYSYVEDKFREGLTRTGLPLMLYIDTPFCMKACKFCNCRPYEAKCGGEQYNEYYPYLYDSIDKFRNLLLDFPPVDIYFGGGTPFFMDSQTMQTVFDTIPNFKEIPNKVMEGHPGLLSDKKLQLIIDNKFSYISLGVQTFNKELLDSQNRIPIDFEKTKEKIKIMQDNGIVVNCDLITFIDHVGDDALELYRQDLEKIRELGPDTVTCYYNFYKLRTQQYENQELVKEDKETLEWIRKYRSEMVRFARRNNYTMHYDFKTFLSIEHIKNNPTLTTQIFLTGRKSPHKYSCSGFPNYRPNEIALGIGGYEHHITYGHIGRDFSYEMRLKDSEPLLEELT